MAIYIVFTAFLIAYIASIWYVVDTDNPSNYEKVKDYIHSKYYIFNNLQTGLMICSIVALYYFNTEKWAIPTIAILVLFTNSILVVKHKKHKNKQ